MIATLAAAALTLAAGFTDALAYIGYGVFAGNMTGNIVLLAISLADWHIGKLILHAGAIAAFLAGVIAARLLRRFDGAAALLLAASLLALAAMGHLEGALLHLCLLAAAMGAQNAAVSRFGGVSLNTAFLTGDLQRLGATLADPQPPRKRLRVAATIAAAIGAYAAGAAGGALAIAGMAHPLLLPAGVLLVMAGVTLAIRNTKQMTASA